MAFDKTNASASLFPTVPGNGCQLETSWSAWSTPACACTCLRSSEHRPGCGAAGFGLIAEDGNPLPGVPRVQSEVFMAAGKTYDVMINVPAAGATALPIFDRQLSLSANATARDAGMLAYISVNGAGLPSAGAFASTLR